MRRALGAGLEGAVLVQLGVLAGVLTLPGLVRRGEVQREVEGLGALRLGDEEPFGVRGEGVGEVVGLLGADPVAVHRRPAVRAAAALVGVPVDEAGAGLVVGAEVPFAAEAEPVAGVGEQVGEEGPAGQEVDARAAGVVVGEPVVDAVLGGQLAGEQGGAGR